MVIPKDLLYTETHEWVRIDADIATIGITDFAQHELGDIVYVELPDTGEEVLSGSSFGSIEAVKAVEDLKCPLSGEVIESNSQLENTPEIINNSPYEQGWLLKIKISDKSELDGLLSSEAYQEMIG